jgi:hypothetical protein
MAAQARPVEELLPSSRWAPGPDDEQQRPPVPDFFNGSPAWQRQLGAQTADRRGAERQRTVVEAGKLDDDREA